MNPKTKRIIVTDDCSKNKSWMDSVVAAFLDWKLNHPEFLPMQGPIRMDVVFYMPRPKYHFSKNGQIKPDAPRAHTKAPDRTKILRSTEDALKGFAWHDDSQIVSGNIEKFFTDDFPGAVIEIKEWAGRVRTLPSDNTTNLL
jgi:Holliday junction resolvase RusA-like endonuclease